MQIFVLTAGRPNKQVTLDHMPTAVLDQTWLVVQHGQETAHKKWIDMCAGVKVLPEGIDKISPTRQWLLENADEKYICMVDDDLTFSHREEHTGTKLHANEDMDTEDMFKELAELIQDDFIHAGVSIREGNNHNDQTFAVATRMVRILAYDRDKVNELGCRFDRIEFKQDFDMTLQLLRLGYKNCVLFAYAQNQSGSNVAGGCSKYRTPEVMTRCAHDLQALHPEFVTVVEKETKRSWGGGTRTDVRIAWKKAYKSSGAET